MNFRQQPGGTSDDMVSVGRAIVEAITELRQLFASVLGVSSSVGNFVFVGGVGNSQVINDPNVTAASVIVMSASGTGSGGLMAGAAMLVPIFASFVPGVSFTVQTADSSTPGAGNYGIRYVIFNPLT